MNWILFENGFAILRLGIFDIFKKSNIRWPQQPLTEKVLKFNMILTHSVEIYFFQTIKIKLF